MTQILIFGIMLLGAVLPFMLLTVLIRRRKPAIGLAVIGAILAISAVFLSASLFPIGIDSGVALLITLLVCVPAVLGSTAGAFLGWILRRQDAQAR